MIFFSPVIAKCMEMNLNTVESRYNEVEGTGKTRSLQENGGSFYRGSFSYILLLLG